MIEISIDEKGDGMSVDDGSIEPIVGVSAFSIPGSMAGWRCFDTDDSVSTF
jgi:hypothetical protein